MFAPLPVAMEKLEFALQSLNAVAIQTPPPIMDLGRRLRAIYERQRPQGYQLLSKSDWRQLPYALWLKGAPALTDTDPSLVNRYWTEALPAACSHNPRRTRRWLTPLFFTYCETFAPADPGFQAFAQNFRQVLEAAIGPMAEKLRAMHAGMAFFDPEHAAQGLASLLFVKDSASIDTLMAEELLWPGFPDTPLGMAVLRAGLQLSPEQLRQPTTVFRLLSWIKRLPATVVKTEMRVLLANALLLTWWPLRKVDESVKNTLVEFFVREYGDPRLASPRHYQWEGVEPQALTVLTHWLTGNTLQGFVKILERTADETWRYRQKFWMAYYDQGHVEEAWLALGRDAQVAALGVSHLVQQSPGMRYGRLEGGAAANQSVLLLRIGDMVFTEWSHNGSLRAYKEGEWATPRFYQPRYDGNDLRELQSLDFHEGQHMRPELPHKYPEKGWWQRKARDMIHRHTGVYLPDREIM